MRAPYRTILAWLLLLAPGTALSYPGADLLAGEACAGQAARFEDAKGFTLLVTRSGEVRIENPLRPLTPEVTRVLEVAVGGKRATIYGPDLASLRRGGPPAAMQASLGGPIRWDASLPPLPDPLDIVDEKGRVLAELSFKVCEPPPSLAPEPQPKGPAQAAKKKGGPPKRTAAKREGAAPKPPDEKTPPGFNLPQGAIAE